MAQCTPGNGTSRIIDIPPGEMLTNSLLQKTVLERGTFGRPSLAVCRLRASFCTHAPESRNTRRASQGCTCIVGLLIDAVVCLGALGLVEAALRSKSAPLDMLLFLFCSGTGFQYRGKCLILRTTRNVYTYVCLFLQLNSYHDR